ncbi:hypothetical protein O6379_23950, partial [Salmonella enterica subsp. enterica]|uniref:hypothetical protein n=1 Tax=Salmonella enterica TaxID=28901 RepID=UPI0022B633FE|nr:hypothetical protein [Salmonella enterica]
VGGRGGWDFHSIDMRGRAHLLARCRMNLSWLERFLLKLAIVKALARGHCSQASTDDAIVSIRALSRPRTCSSNPSAGQR